MAGVPCEVVGEVFPGKVTNAGLDPPECILVVVGTLFLA